jgi:RimJ/RimL family protein N-acetyltransferase
VSGDLVLRTERLMLRPLELTDAELLWPSCSDPEIARYMAWETHTDASETVAFLRAEVARREEGRGATWGVFKDGEFCGIISLIGLVRGHRALTYDKAELAYWLGRDYQHQGIATEAALRVVEYGFDDLGLHKIVVAHFAANNASEKLIKRLGFRYVGEQIEEFQKDGVWHSQKSYEILKHEFEAFARTN